MKRTFLTILISAGVSLLIPTDLFAQAPAAPAANPAAANQPQSLNQDEKAEDAALLQQLEATSPQGQAKPYHKNQWAPGAAGWAAGGGAGAKGLGPVATTFQGKALVGRQTGAPRALLVRTAHPEAKGQAALEEDLAVMSHLLTKAIDDLPGGQTRTMTALGVDVFFTPNSTPMRSLYLDNYGAVFFLNVGLPLVAPPEKPQEEKPAGDSAWEDARQELYGQRTQEGLMGETSEEYSQEKVDKLKETLLETLKNATNIRELKPDEFVTVYVAGGTSGGGRIRFVKHNPPGTLGGNVMAADQATLPSRRTVLTIRIAKSDIDSYAKSKLSSEEFQKRARITTYAGGDSSGVPGDGFAIGGFYNGKPRF